MKAEAIHCPACGAPLSLRGLTEYVRCAYCESTIHVRMRNADAEDCATITDPATGVVIGRVRVPHGYRVSGALRPDVVSYTYPFGVSVAAKCDSGGALSYSIGEGFCDRSKCPMLSGMYSQGLDRVSRTHYKNFQDAAQYADACASAFAASAQSASLSFIEERPMPLSEPFDEHAALESYKRQMAFEKQRSGNADMAKDLGYYLQGICRVYSLRVQQQTYTLAVATLVKAWKYLFVGGQGVLAGGIGSIGEIGEKLRNACGGSLRNSIGDSLGGMDGNLRKALFGNSIIGRALEKNAQQSSQQSSQQPSQQPSQHPQSAFHDMPHNAIIDWQSDGVFMLCCPADRFEAAFSGAFTEFCSTLQIDGGIREKMFNMQNDILRDIDRHSRQSIDQMNRQFQSWQQIHATQQAAFDSYNRAWWDRTNAQDNARRAAYRSKMAAEDRTSGNFSEAIRGVNTYVRDDGTEVEVSVAYDRAYTNNIGDTLGSNSAFEPGGNWREMNRK